MTARPRQLGRSHWGLPIHSAFTGTVRQIYTATQSTAAPIDVAWCAREDAGSVAPPMPCRDGDRYRLEPGPVGALPMLHTVMGGTIDPDTALQSRRCMQCGGLVSTTVTIQLDENEAF